MKKSEKTRSRSKGYAAFLRSKAKKRKGTWICVFFDAEFDSELKNTPIWLLWVKIECFRAIFVFFIALLNTINLAILSKYTNLNRFDLCDRYTYRWVRGLIVKPIASHGASRGRQSDFCILMDDPIWSKKVNFGLKFIS